ncbi:MAG: hypothetical protein GXX99_01750 [Clostridiales bacterium]|nr:hypothetical protein [Clostridiales bacterium]
MNLTEKAAYLRGLMDGMNLEENNNHTKLFKAIIEMLDEIAVSVSDLEDEVLEVEDALDVIDEDLGMLEELVYDDMLDDEDDDYYEVECPVCGEVFFIDEETATEGETVCPACDAEIEIELEDDDDDDDDDEDDEDDDED